MLRRDEFADDFLPVRHVRRGTVEVQQAADQIVGALTLQHERHFVNRVFHILFFNDRLRCRQARNGKPQWNTVGSSR